MITNPPQQRDVPRHRYRRPTPRLAATAEHHAHLAGRLTPRDRWLARMLYEHRVFTSHQLVELAFPAPRSANLRLLKLYQWRVLDRFQPFIPVGAAPMHYVLDVAGATMLAHEDGLDPKDIGYRHATAIGIAHSLTLAHTTGTNGFFTRLIALTRDTTNPGRLDAWWPESRCARHIGDIVRPDAYGAWTEHGHLRFYLEYDCGTEPLRRLAAKLHAYHQLRLTTVITTPVLFWFPTQRRETTARSALAATLAELDRPDLVPVATTSATHPLPEHDNTPAAARWLPLGHQPHVQHERLRLASLGQAWPNLDTGTPPSSGATTTARLTPPPPQPPDLPLYRIRR